MGQPVIYIDTSRVLEGKLPELKAAMSELVEFVRLNEPQIISYNAFFSEDESTMTVAHFHRDSDSLAFHMETAGHLFPKVAPFIDLIAINVYGPLSPELVERMKQKAEMLGSGKVLVHGTHQGFARFPRR